METSVDEYLVEGNKKCHTSVVLGLGLGPVGFIFSDTLHLS